MNTPTRPDRRTPPAPVAVGGRGDPGDEELLIDGQEEVFSRSEVELGRIEHAAGRRTPSGDREGRIRPPGR